MDAAEVMDDLSAYNAPAEVAGQMQAQRAEALFELWPENSLPASVFLACGTQWDRAGINGQRVALNYTRAESVIRLMRVPRQEWPQLLMDLRTMEAAALAELFRE
jgi:hypothetical protein